MANAVMIDAKLQADIDASVARALAEDIGDGDITAELIPRRAHRERGDRDPRSRCGVRHSLGRGGVPASRLPHRDRLAGRRG